ncbi:DUF1365 domain-containing protein [Blastopirellula retiformator]|uniref:DUF1365 domain-containing protein n=1 Tax=Blastopirellula retiformator TaxID=2527970 RepID=A0A5C5V8D5_9BACT|nr:DUF1365 domain-containing protein [Blastopirellula retiformator]TWT34551.1 hypothetical protein Enr8_19610 [Blastopirellula retiformator]
MIQKVATRRATDRSQDNRERASCLYVGAVRHRRFTPIPHQFRRPLFLFSIDLDEVDSVFRFPLLWSTQPYSLFRFCRSDYLGAADRPLAECVRDLVHEKLGLALDGPIRLLTQIRCLGIVFNPISLFYCYDAEENLRAIVAEVTNTPWGERYSYVIPFAGEGRIGRFANPKDFHVSPFMPMEMEYRWRVSRPEDRLTVHLENMQGDEKAFDATLGLSRRALSLPNVLKTVLWFPLMSAQMLAAIYWQALRLWWKKVPYHPHPQAAAESTHPETAADSLST